MPRIDTDRPSGAPVRWLTVPNVVSVLRLAVFVPLTMWLIAQPGLELWATASLVVFGATDWIDGALARGLDQVSRAGEVLDPIADRFGILLIALGLAVHDRLPWFVILTIGAFDLALALIGLVRWHRVREGRVTWLGKLRTALLMIAMPLHLLSFAPELAAEPWRTVSWWMLVVGTLLHGVTAIAYAVRYLRASPNGKPDAPRPDAPRPDAQVSGVTPPVP